MRPAKKIWQRGETEGWIVCGSQWGSQGACTPKWGSSCPSAWWGHEGEEYHHVHKTPSVFWPLLKVHLGVCKEVRKSLIKTRFFFIVDVIEGSYKQYSDLIIN